MAEPLADHVHGHASQQRHGRVRLPEVVPPDLRHLMPLAIARVTVWFRSRLNRSG
jgi:hypothetical protein